MDFTERFNVLIFNIDPDVTTNAEIELKTISMTPLVEEGQIRFVLSWPDAPADLDLHPRAFAVLGVSNAAVMLYAL